MVQVSGLLFVEDLFFMQYKLHQIVQIVLITPNDKSPMTAKHARNKAQHVCAMPYGYFDLRSVHVGYIYGGFWIPPIHQQRPPG